MSIFAILPFLLSVLAQEQAPVSRVTTRLVQVTVVVQDRNGDPVADLSPDDFEITEQGKPQPVSFFSIESNQKATGRPGALAPNRFSNLPSRLGASQNLTVILFDALNTPAADQVRAKQEVLRFLLQLQPQDRVALYGLGTSLRAVHDFTGNAEALARALNRFKTRLSPDLVSSVPTVEDHSGLAGDAQEQAIVKEMDAFLNESSQLTANYYVERRMAITLQALDSIAQHLLSLPGRKSLVWISGSFPFTYGTDTFQVNRANEGTKNFADVIARATRSINTANVAIYPVDARGFLGSATLNASANAAASTTSARQGIRSEAGAMDEVLAARNTMQELAQKTGGRAMYNVSDVRGAIRRALDDSRVTYTLGYYSSNTNFDGKFRQIRVSVNRPGSQLMYRRGYYAYPDEPADEAHRQNAINTAARGLLDATGIGISADIGKPEAGSPARQFSIDVDAKSVTLEPEQDLWTGGLDVVFAQLDGEGNVLTSIGRPVPIRLTAAQRQQLVREGLRLNAPLEIVPKCEEVRIIIRDARSGAIGTLTIPANL